MVLSGQRGDRIIRNYKDDCQTPLFEDKMKNFSIQRYRLDDYCLDFIPSHSDFSKLRSFLMVLIRCHGNAFVEQDCSINKEVLIENLADESLISHRANNAIMYYAVIKKIEINKNLIYAARNAHGLYQVALKKNQESADIEVKRTAEKRKVSDKIKELEKKKQNYN